MSIISSHPTYAMPDMAHVPSGRLIVLMTEQDAGQTDAPNRIWALASERGLDVLLVGLASRADEQISLRRQLVSTAAAIRDGRVSVEIRLESGDGWTQDLRTIWRPGDVIACYDRPDERARNRPLDEILRSDLGADLYILPAPAGASPGRLVAPARVLSWAGSIAVVVGFFWIQLRVVQGLHDWVQTAVLSLSVFVELGLIQLWDSMTA